MSSIVFDPAKPRASEFARCARMAYYRATGHIGQLDPIADEYLWRGHVFEEIVVRQFEARLGRENVVRHPSFDWGMGEDGHSDAFLIPTKELVEVKSSSYATPGSPMIEMATTQLKLALRFYEHPSAGAAEGGIIYLLNPNVMKPADVIKVVLTDEDREQIAQALEVLREALEVHANDLPERPPARVCSLPQQARGRLCAFGEVCFADWLPPSPGQSSDPEVLELVRRLDSIRREMRPRKADLEELKSEEDEVRGLLSEYLAEGETIVGPYAVTRTHVRRSPRFEPKLARAAGFPLEALEEFFVAGSEYDTWKIRLAEEPGEIEYGEEAPF